MTTREEHLNWCKKRALQYVDAGDNTQAFASMCSDVMSSPETESHRDTNKLGMQLMMAGHLESPDKMRDWINGYN